MNKFNLKALLAVSLMASPIAAATIVEEAQQFSDAAYACKNDANATNALCTLIASYNNDKRALAFTASKFIMGAGSLIVAKDGALAAQAVAETGQLERFNSTTTEKILDIKTAIQHNPKLAPFADEIETTLQSEASMSYQVKERMSVFATLKARGQEAWDTLTTAAQAAYTALKNSLSDQVNAVVTLITGSRITADSDHTDSI